MEKFSYDMNDGERFAATGREAARRAQIEANRIGRDVLLWNHTLNRAVWFEAPKAPFHLPVGTRVAVSPKAYRPRVSDEAGDFRAVIGEVVESHPGGLHAVKFDVYANTVDYSRREAAAFFTTIR